MIDKILQDLKTLIPEQLQEIDRVIQALAKNDGIYEGGLHYFGSFLGIDWDERGQAFMQLGPYNENTYGVAQGGALYTLADIAIGKEIIKKLKKEQQVYTLEMKMNYLKKGKGEKLFAETEFLHWGKTTVVAQCQILDPDGGIVAHALGTFYIVNKN